MYFFSFFESSGRYLYKQGACRDFATDNIPLFGLRDSIYGMM